MDECIQKVQTKRIEWIDLAKGICMVLVIIGHYEPLPKMLGVLDESVSLTYVRILTI